MGWCPAPLTRPGDPQVTARPDCCHPPRFLSGTAVLQTLRGPSSQHPPPPPEQLRPPHICNVAYSLGLMRDSLGTPSLCHAPAECTWRAITCGGRVRRCMSQGFSCLGVSLPQECCCWWQGCLPSRAGWRIDVLSAQVLTRSAAPRWTGFEVVGGECALTCLATPPGHRPGPAASSLS